MRLTGPLTCVMTGVVAKPLYATAPVKRKRLIAEAELATIWVTNPQRRLFGKTGPTKIDIAVYYALVGDFWMFDERTVYAMRYDADGRLLEVEDRSSDASYVAACREARAVALAASEPLERVAA